MIGKTAGSLKPTINHTKARLCHGERSKSARCGGDSFQQFSPENSPMKFLFTITPPRMWFLLIEISLLRENSLISCFLVLESSEAFALVKLCSSNESPTTLARTLESFSHLSQILGLHQNSISVQMLNKVWSIISDLK